MIHYHMYVNHGSIDYPDFDWDDAIVSDSIPGDSCNALLDYLHLMDGRTDYVTYGDLIVTQSAVCSWSTV